MAKILRCGELMPGCNRVIEGKDEAEVMQKGAEHARTAHGMSEVPPGVGRSRSHVVGQASHRFVRDRRLEMR